MKNKKLKKRKSVYWKVELIGRAAFKILLILATIGYIWLGLSIFILLNSR